MDKKEKIKEKFSQLTPTEAGVFYSAKLTQDFTKMKSNLPLNEEEYIELNLLVMSVLVGMETIQDFRENISKTFPNKSQTISDYVEKNIFIPLSGKDTINENSIEQKFVISPVVIEKYRKESLFIEISNQTWFIDILQELYQKHNVGTEGRTAIFQVVKKAIVSGHKDDLQAIASNPALANLSKDLMDFYEYAEDKYQQLIAESQKEDDLIHDDIPVPVPPKFVSPKVADHVAEIRPKPRQGLEDPYREAIDERPTTND